MKVRLARPIFAVAVLAVTGASARAAVAAWNPDAVYAEREAAFKQAIAARPQDPQPLVDLAAFYLKPVAARDVRCVDGKVRRVMVPLRNQWQMKLGDVYSVRWVFRGDPDLAKPLLERALGINRKHPGAIRATALLLRMKSSLDSMWPYVQAALANDPTDLDMCHLYLDHEMGVAANLETQAGQLLLGSRWEEPGPNGTTIIHTINPGPGERARADALREQAQQVRKNAIEPLRNLVKTLQADPNLAKNPAKKSKEHLANAIYYAWLGKGGTAAAAAGSALDTDPTNLDALDFLVDIIDPSDTTGRYQKYKSLLDSWRGVDSTPIKRESPQPRGPRY